MPIREAGDSAVVLQLEVGEPQRRNEIDAEVNIRAIRIAESVRQRRIPGVRDVVPTFRSVAVFFDPLASDLTQSSKRWQNVQTSVSPAKRAESSKYRSCMVGTRVPTLPPLQRCRRTDAGSRRRATCVAPIPRVHARVPSGIPVHGAGRRCDCGTATADASRQGGGGVGWDRWSADWHLPPRVTGRLADHRSNAARAIRCGQDATGTAGCPATPCGFVPVGLTAEVRLKPDTTYDRLKPDTS